MLHANANQNIEDCIILVERKEVMLLLSEVSRFD
jgi:hypothetical protein